MVFNILRMQILTTSGTNASTAGHQILHADWILHLNVLLKICMIQAFLLSTQGTLQKTQELREQGSMDYESITLFNSI